ncbi:MAG: hypothetical protein PHE61_03350 [Candidatus Omnitrophica bacterium]|nr:hypothetical protein [Candidatus Omnitrophota bacterium]
MWVRLPLPALQILYNKLGVEGSFAPSEARKSCDEEEQRQQSGWPTSPKGEAPTPTPGTSDFI